MYRYEDFKEYVAKEIIALLPEKYKGYTVSIKTQHKVNKDVDFLSVEEPFDQEKYQTCGPALNLNNLFMEYIRTGNINMTMARVVDEFLKMEEISKEVLKDFDFEGKDIKKQIIFQLINYRQNKELLKEVPHRRFLDLAVIYRIFINNDGCHETTIINEKTAKKLNLSEESLYKYAEMNTRRLMPIVTFKLKDIIQHMTPQFMEIPEEIIQEIAGDKIYVLTNAGSAYGATGLLYNDALKMVTSKIGKRVHIVPSSMHEVIITPIQMNPEELSEIIQLTNADSVDIEDRLSNSVYMFDGTNLSLAFESDRRL